MKSESNQISETSKREKMCVLELIKYSRYRCELGLPSQIIVMCDSG